MIVETGAEEEANPGSDISEATEAVSPRAGRRACKSLKAVGDGRGLLRALSARLHGTTFTAPSASMSFTDWEWQEFCEGHASDGSGLEAPV